MAFLPSSPFRYRGYYFDTTTGLYYLHSRFYDPVTGRLLSPDSVEYIDPETINGLNLYAYCGNNPVMYCDCIGAFPVPNTYTRAHYSKTIFELFNFPVGKHLIGSFTLKASKTAEIEITYKRGTQKGIFFAYTDLEYTSLESFENLCPDTVSYGVGFNLWEWYSVELGVINDGHIFTKTQITPWVQIGGRIGSTGIGIDFSLTTPEFTYDASLNIGWVTIAAILFCIFCPASIPIVVTVGSGIVSSGALVRA